MKKVRLAAVAAVMGAVASFWAGPVQAAPYVDVVVVLTADSPVVGGKPVNFTATTTAGTIDCDWTVTFTGAASSDSGTRSASGTSISGTFDSKVVTTSTPTSMKAVCVYDDETAVPSAASATTDDTVTPAIYTGDAGATLQAVAQASADTATVILLPVGGGDGDGDDGSLPDTGGFNVMWLLVGAGLLLVGGGVTYAARRRHTGR